MRYVERLGGSRAAKGHRDPGSLGEDMLGREVGAGELELECARKVRAVVMLSQSVQRQQRVRIGERPAPTV